MGTTINVSLYNTPSEMGRIDNKNHETKKEMNENNKNENIKNIKLFI